jgi:hypothetical protein
MDEETKNKVLAMHKEFPKYSHQKIADELGLTRQAVWRLLSNNGKDVALDTTLWNEEEREVYDQFKVWKKLKKEKKWFTRIIPLKRTLVDGADVNDLTGDYTMSDSITQKNNFLDNYMPSNDIRPLDVELDGNKIVSQMPFVAKKRNNGQVIFPKFFYSPLNALDMIVLQDIYMKTICGTIIDILVSFTKGKGIRPVLKLNSENEVEIKKIKPFKLNEKDTLGPKDPKVITKSNKDALGSQPEESKEELMARVLAENEIILDPIIAIDNSFSDPKQTDPLLDETFDEKIEALIRNHWIFGRSMLTYEYFKERTFKWNGVPYPDIPNVLKIPHTRDMGFVHIDQLTHKLKGVSLMFSTEIIESPDMLYLEHNTNSAIYNGKHYGYSKMERMIDDGRSLKKLKARDFPNVASIGYAGFSVIAFAADEKGTESENNQNTAFVNSMTVGSPNATTLQDPVNGMHVHNINTDAKIKEMIEMAQYHAESAAKSAQVPTTLVSKEKDPNRDTLLGILRLFKENVIRLLQNTISKKIDAQWYMKNFRIIYNDNQDILDNFHIESEFIDIKLESWDDLVESVVKLNQLQKLKAEANGKLLGLDNFESMIDPDAEPIPTSSEIEGKDGSKLSIQSGPKQKSSDTDKE